MKKALIGFTGFVGSNLYAQGNFTHTFNSSNITAMHGQHFDEIWCAGIKAVKWWANKNPEEDWQGIKSLIDVLKTVSCERFIHISTVDVFKTPLAVNENTMPERESLHAYGLHRLFMEDFIQEHFKNTVIIRLPGLFGKGLSKNIIYDFMHDNQLDNINSESRFQFYDLATLYEDCIKVLKNNLALVHFAVEPLTVGSLVKEVFKKDFNNIPNQPAVYDMHTIYASYWDKQGDYLQNKLEVLEKMQKFVKTQVELL